MNKTLYFAIFLGVTAMVVTTVAYLAYQWTAPIIEANEIEKINNNIALIYSPDDGYKRNENQGSNDYSEKSPEYNYINRVYEVLNSDEELHAIIYDITTQGRNGDVSALIAVNPYTDLVEQVIYYSHGETPNIGEKYTRQENIDLLIGQSVADDVYVDVIAGASTTWVAIEEMFNQIELHYEAEEVHVGG